MVTADSGSFIDARTVDPLQPNPSSTLDLLFQSFIDVCKLSTKSKNETPLRSLLRRALRQPATQHATILN